ncbi:MAG: sugar ABC transporter substrate-binding protein [Anaerolineae bacterium]|nr:sugar ABC transporter substrate-binding protein [Anaerolineae bacterium]MCA9908777.1 sugar ABC transporter substrate-binding protein [Anaerolineae bacterium]
MFKSKIILPLILLGVLALMGTGVLAQDSGVDFDCSDFQAAAVVHFIGPYTQQLLDGAAAAAAECGAEITTAGPAAFDSQAQVTMFQDAVSAGADAIVIVAFPAEFWIRPIDDAVARGVSVSTFDVESPASLESLHTAPKQKDQGRVMAEALSDALGEGAEGTVVSGICLPGLELIEARVTGFKEKMAELQPGVEIVGPLDVSFDQTENFARWNDIVDQNPDALGYIGFCENDLPSLVRIKEDNPDVTGYIGSIGINPDGLNGIRDGVALVAVGQKPFMQGYVAMRGMLESLANGEAVPRGWIDVRPEVVTAENVDAVIAREESLADGTAETQAYYQDEIDAIFADLSASVQSFGDLLGD